MHYHAFHTDFLIIQKANKLFSSLNFLLFHVVLEAFKYVSRILSFIQVYQALVTQLFCSSLKASNWEEKSLSHL